MLKKSKKLKESSSIELAGDKVISFKEREKRSIELKNRIAESYPMVGGASDDNLWRSLNQLSNRDLYTLTQKRMQDIAFFLYDSNPMAKRILEIMRDFVVGDGFKYSVVDPGVKEVIDNFWNDPDNNLDEELDTNVLELGIFGELCLPTWVNKADGSVKLGYIDPVTILRVFKDKSNPKIHRKLRWKKPKSPKEIDLDIINIDKRITSKTEGKLIGECFFFAINKVSGATRGRSDLLSLADWLDGHDQFLFARLERAFLINSFIWDITCEDMNEKELKEFVKGLTLPKSGSIRAHNQKIKWEAIVPKLESDDASNEARLFKNQILGGAGYPEHWFSEGGKTTRATALEMGLPTLKKLKSRQRKFIGFLKRILNYVIDQAIIAGTLKEGVNREFKIIPTPIVSRDNKGVSEAMSGLVSGLVLAKEQGWITDKKAKVVLNAVLSQLGVEMEADEEEKKEEKQNEE